MIRATLAAAFAPHGGVLLAVSGGPDSMALLALALEARDGGGLFVATVDHGLRVASATEAAMVADWCRARDLPHTTLRWHGDKPQAGLQAAAREARLSLLIAEAKRLGCTAVATAHHADDQAETVLMRLCAGSGIGGLAAMRRQSLIDGIALLRPLLHVPGNALRAVCERRAVPFLEDPSNTDPRFGRARVRRMMPLLAQEGLTTERLLRLSERAAEAEDALNAVAHAALARAAGSEIPACPSWNWRLILAEPEAIRLRVLALAFCAASGQEPPLRLLRLESLAATVDAAAKAGLFLRRTLAGQLVTLRANGMLSIAPAPPRKSRERG